MASPLRTALDGLRSKSVIVTGGGRGLGRAIAEGFATEGAYVAVIGRSRAPLEQAVATISETGGTARAFVADVVDEGALEAMCAAVKAEFGAIDVLVNNAGINPFYKCAEDTSLAEWQQIIDVNLTGVFLACKHVGRAMLTAGSGAIINVTSVAGHVGLARTTAYCAAKGGVELITKQLAIEWANRGVRVNAVAPAYFETDLTAGLRSNERLSNEVTDRTPMGRFGKVDELVGACLYLASSAASYVTGHSIKVDGGWTAC